MYEIKERKKVGVKKRGENGGKLGGNGAIIDR